MGREILRHPLQRLLVLDARGNDMLDEPALMELLAMRQHVGDKRDADRAAGIARRIDQAPRPGRSCPGGMPSKDAVRIGMKISGSPRPSGMRDHAKNRSRHRRRGSSDRTSDSAQMVAPAAIRYFGWMLARQAADDEHHRHGDETARREHEAGPGGRVAEIAAAPAAAGIGSSRAGSRRSPASPGSRHRTGASPPSGGRSSGCGG